MRLSKLFMPTLKDAPSDAQIASNALMLRGALMRKLASGLYSYLPLGVRVLQKATQIVREEMNNIDSQECIMPLLLPKDLLEPSGRWEIFKKALFRLKDRHEVEHALGPTHEEAFTETAKNDTQSYKQLPLSLYQIHTKFRDEVRPRFGIIRSREFIMKDAYSFHMTEECLDKTYKDMSGAYSKIFQRMGLKTVSVKADSGAMGGSGSEEFMVLADIGEEEIVFCTSCDYRANVERAEVVKDEKAKSYTNEKHEKVHTPNIKTIEDLEKFFNTDKTNFIKTLIYKTEKEDLVAVLIRGDLEVNEIKLTNHLGGLEIELASESDIKKATGARVGFAGPIGLHKDVRVLADYSILSIENAVIGGNEDDMHIKNVNVERDVLTKEYVDLRKAREGDKCPQCGKPLSIKHGLELGHVFKLGKKYTNAFNFTVLDEDNKPVTPTMGCYGIGVNRAVAAVVEQHHDDRGIIFPISVCPYEVIIVAPEKEGTESFALAEKIYKDLLNSKVEAAFDDRNERMGVKLADADLIGFPIRIIVGKKSIETGNVEIKLRREKESDEVSKDSALEYVLKLKTKLFDEVRV